MRDRGWTRPRQPEGFEARSVLRRQADGWFSGAVRFLVLGARGIRVLPAEKTGERGPDCRIDAGQTDLGAASETIRRGRDGRLSVKLGAIGFGEPVNAALVVIDGVPSLDWSPSAPKAD